ncbi:MAG: prolyl oligopeptidase family serine peptidase [Bryobacteraceae bacterium]
MSSPLGRRGFLALASANLVTARADADDAMRKPIVSEEACPLETLTPVAPDGFKGFAVLRKPPGAGPFPAILWIHGGLTTLPRTALQDLARSGTNPSRFLAAGYVVIVPTYRSRDEDPQSKVSLEDCLAVVEHARNLPYVDAKSILVFGCSGGGDLALEIAAATNVCGIIPEEPASVLMSGVLNTGIPKQGARYSPRDALPILEEPRKYYTAVYQKVLRAKIARIQCPILILQGDEDRQANPVNRYNAQVLIPELRAAGKTLEVITYPREQHCFCYTGRGPRPAAIWKAFRDMDAFCRRHIATQPRAIEAALVK